MKWLEEMECAQRAVTMMMWCDDDAAGEGEKINDLSGWETDFDYIIWTDGVIEMFYDLSVLAEVCARERGVWG